MDNRLILIRHGQSQWNLENRFTGWTDIDLSKQGCEEALEAGQRIRALGIVVDRVFTSLLVRAIRTAWIAQEQMDALWLPVERSWQLNERHYGALQGLNKAEMAEQFGEEQVHIWRRSYDTPPPALDYDDNRHPRHDRRYRDLEPQELPAAESLKDTLERVLPYWETALLPRIQAGETIMVSAHGNSLRALVKHLDDISDEEIPTLNIPTGVPLVYQFDGAQLLNQGYLE